MKRYKMLILNKILYVAIIIGTIVSLIIVYGNIETDIAVNFVKIYAILALFMLIYIPIIVLINIKKLDKEDIKKRTLKFIKLFFALIFINYIVDYIKRPMEAKMFSNWTQSLGLSFGIYFLDVMFLKGRSK